MVDVDRFLQIENNYCLNKKEVLGVNYWNYIRFSLWNYDICSESLGLSEPHNKKNMSLKVILNLLMNYIISSIRVKRHDILVLSHPRRCFNGETYECIYTDDLIGEKYDALFLEEPFQFEHLKPVKSKNIVYNDRIIINSAIHVKLFKIFRKKKYTLLVKQIKKEIEPAIDELKNLYNWSRSVDYVAKKAADICIRCAYEKRIYKKILSQVKPKVIVEVVHYGRKCMLFNEIAKEMHIPTIELQHGTMYREHIAYQYSKDENIKQLPDKLFLYSEFWKRNISLPLSDNDVLVTGSINYEKKLYQYKDSQRGDNRLTLLFISQGTIGKHLSNLAVEVNNLIDRDKVRIIYKLHPSEYATWRTELSCLVDTGIEVIDNGKVNLFEIFSWSDYQIGAYSTALFEGMGFGLETLIYNVGHYDIMLPLIESGYAHLVTSCDDVLNLICNDDYEKKDGRLFWKENALQNARAELDAMIK